MKYKELFRKYETIAGLSFDEHGVSLMVLQPVGRQLIFKSVSRIHQIHLIQSTAEGLSFNVQPSTVVVLKETLHHCLPRSAYLSVSIPSDAIFHCIIPQGMQSLSYLLDTRAPWPARDCFYQVCQWGGKAHMWAISRAFLDMLDTFFKFRLKISYSYLDVNVLAWLRFLIVQSQYDVPDYLPEWMIRDWPSVWYAPALGTALNAHAIRCTAKGAV